MIQAFGTAVAGLRASALRLGVAAGNIANARSSGAASPYDGYVPKRAEQSTTAAGGPKVEVRPVANPSQPAYRPNDPRADAAGIVGMPNVNLPEQFVEMQVAQRSYEASLAVVETTNDLMRTLVDDRA